MGDDYLAQTISTESVEIAPAHMALRLYLEDTHTLSRIILVSHQDEFTQVFQNRY